MSKADEIEDKEIDDFLKFIKVASEQCKEKGKQYEFICPLCGGNAEGIKSSYNGHLWANCNSCGMNVIE